MNLNASGDDLKTCWISLSIFRGIPYFITVPLAALLPRTIFTFKCAAASYAFGRRCPANEELRRYLVKKDYYSVSILKDYLREVILLQASDSHLLSVLFRQTMEIIGRSIPFEEEPMINLLGWFDNCQWTVCLFPRRTRRPRQFYAEGTEKILFSPGCVDMGRPDHFSPGRRFPEIFSRFIDRYVQSGNRRPG